MVVDQPTTHIKTGAIPNAFKSPVLPIIALADRLGALRGPGENYSDVILRLVAVGHEH
jgi:hypothetical protein